jgi:hypothetical protein
MVCGTGQAHLDPERARTNLLVACYTRNHAFNAAFYCWIEATKECRAIGYILAAAQWSLEFEWFRWTTKRGCFALAAALKKCGLMCRNVRRIMMEMLWSKRFENNKVRR